MWLSGGLFLGWAVGVNGFANVFATAVASRMVRFATVANLSVVFVILGGVINGPAAIDTLSRLGGVGSLPAAFTVALASAAAITFISVAGLPVSVSQALVGAVFGLGLARGIQTIKLKILGNIVIGWNAAPVISGALLISCCHFCCGSVNPV